MELDIQKMIFEFIGGLGIFLFGIKYMGDGLQRSAGDKLRDILDKFTTNPLMGVLAGVIVTVLIQSSSGTTVITVGLVSAGFMSLRQAIGVIMGANIGTTVTAFIIGIKVSDYALPIIAVGAILLFFFKNKRIHNIGQIVFGFGALFFGLELMGDGMKPLRTLEAFHDLTVSMSSNPLLGVVVGTVFTVIVQSSSATIGILQELFGQGLIDINAALPVLFGDNIGTTITAVLASIGASIAARRAALTHVIFNLIGTTIFLIFLPLFTNFMLYLQGALHLNPEMTIAFAHGTFNFTNTFIQLPFIGFLAFIVTKLIPGEDSVIEYKTKHLDPIFIEQSSSIALGQAKEEVLRMGQFATIGLEAARDYQTTYSQKNADTAMQLEDAINNLDRKITDYLVLISRSEMSPTESEEHSMLMDTVRDIERIGDHIENVVELVGYQLTNKVKLTDSAKKDLEDMFELTIQTLKDAVTALDDKDTALASKVLKSEEQIDKMERTLRKKHIMRINEGSCTGSAGIVFVDIISNLERIGDHSVNIAEAVLGYRD
ncbi:Na/Pi cotransporter family protein [Metabacillus halosaccharovorans]|uniref:Na/Pi cotransporter family protein n=1 Tax=Metabacillus halosaccharovorans TaxID=930124 RepID=UPI00203BDA87|nr:Na/Pi cotransporter family protein [Metabacillus halosaccharovorans]MCM3442112.1 Na/Pi cotransporter family protein [Metabacillus halosaccharovorans]